MSQRCQDIVRLQSKEMAENDSCHYENVSENHDTNEFEWAYGSENGPDHWHELRSCEAIRKPVWGQSPVNIVTDECQNDFHYYEADAQYDFRPKTAQFIQNTGRTWQIVYAPPNLEDIHDWSYCDGTLRSVYSLSNIHMHWGKEDEHGSEHYIDGKDAAAEIHFVYFNQDYCDRYEEACTKEGGLMIQAVRFELGDPDPELNKILEYLPKIQYKGDQWTLDKFDPFDLMPNKTRQDLYSIYHYYGSMCQPPCAESVTWIIFKRKRTISKEQLQKLRQLHTHRKGCKPEGGENMHIIDNRRVKSLDKLFHLHVENARIDYQTDDFENEYLLQDHWQGTNYREIVSSEAKKPWIGSEDLYNGCYKDDQTVTVRVKELLKPRREDSSDFNCQWKDSK